MIQQVLLRGCRHRRARVFLFLAQLPASPSSGRVALWRRLRGRGASGVLWAWVLPRTDEHGVFLAELADMVRGQGGTAVVFVTGAMSSAEKQNLVARFQADRSREYGEFAERCREFLVEIERETQRRKFTFAELEEIEDDFDKLSAWLGKIQARDFFPSEQTQTASGMLKDCGAALQFFVGAVYTFTPMTRSLCPTATQMGLKRGPDD